MATAGIASPALALAASVAIGAGTSALDYGLNAGSSFSWEGLAMSAAIGGATGAIGFGAGAAISKGVASLAAKSMNGALSIGSKELSLGGKLTGKILPDDAYVVRGGGSKVIDLERNLADGRGISISARSAEGKTIAELSANPNLKNNQISVCRVGDIRAIGGNVISTPTRDIPLHADIFPGPGGAPELTKVFVRQFNPVK